MYFKDSNRLIKEDIDNPIGLNKFIESEGEIYRKNKEEIIYFLLSFTLIIYKI